VYWDREGNPQQILPRNNVEAERENLAKLALKLTQLQVDMLVEAGIPDQLLSMVKEKPVAATDGHPGLSAIQNYRKASSRCPQAETIWHARDVELYLRGADYGNAL
jgi:hypothetical protein